MQWPRISDRALQAAMALAGLALAAPAPGQFVNPSSISEPRGGKGCSFTSLPAINFGAYEDGASSSTRTTAIFSVKCTGVGGVSVTLASGPSSVTGDFEDRRLRGPGGGELRYQLYTNSARTVVWGDGTRDTTPIVVKQSGANKQVIVYAELFAGQSGEVGEYGDVIEVTVLP